MFKIDDYILLVSKCLLSQDKQKALEFIDNHLSGQTPYQFKLLNVINSYCIGFEKTNAEVVEFSNWIMQRKSQAPMRVGELKKGTTHDYPLVLFADQQDKKECYSLKPTYPWPYKLNERDFLVLIEEQKNSDAIKLRLANYLINLADDQSVKDSIDSKGFNNFILSASGKSLLASYIFDFLVEIQRECQKAGSKIQVSEKFKSLLYTQDEDRDIYNSLSPEEQKYYVWQEELFFIPDGSGAEFKELILAQHCSEKIFIHLYESLILTSEDYKQKISSFDEFKKIFEIQSLDDFYFYPVSSFARGIVRTCKENNQSLVIPMNLKERVVYFSAPPADPELKKEYIPTNQILYPTPGESVNYTNYLFSERETISLENEEHFQYQFSLQKFLEMTKFCEDFCNRVQSPFKNYFKSTRLLLDRSLVFTVATPIKIEVGDAEVEEIINETINSLDLIVKLGVNKETITDLLALSIADVSGAMGSWNDQYFQNEKDQSDYIYTLENFFDARRRFFVAVLNTI